MMLIEFIIPTYNRVNPLFTMLYSLLNQDNKNWKAHVIIDDCKPRKAEEIVKSLNDDRIYYSYMDKRYNDWGHTLREYGKQKSDADYIIMTGDDNYYAPVLVSRILQYGKEKPGLIFWKMVHSHGGYCFWDTHPSIGRIDMGAFATRSDLAKKIPLNTKYAADGYFIEDFKRMFPNEAKVKIPFSLFVHN